MAAIVQPTLIARGEWPPVPDAGKRINFPLNERLKAAQRHLTSAALAQIRAEFRAYLGQPRYPAPVANGLADRLCALAGPQQPWALALQQLGREYVLHRRTILGHCRFYFDIRM